MATITEDYVSFETAKLLKEKDFPQEYDRYHALVYNEEDYEDEYENQRMVVQTRLVKAGTLSSYPVGVPEPKCYCPTLQMAMKWLREVHKTSIEITSTGYLIDNDAEWECDIKIERRLYFKHITGEKSFESCANKAIKYCLENLI